MIEILKQLSDLYEFNRRIQAYTIKEDESSDDGEELSASDQDRQ